MHVSRRHAQRTTGLVPLRQAQNRHRPPPYRHQNPLNQPTAPTSPLPHLKRLGSHPPTRPPRHPQPALPEALQLRKCGHDGGDVGCMPDAFHPAQHSTCTSCGTVQYSKVQNSGDVGVHARWPPQHSTVHHVIPCSTCTPYYIGAACGTVL